MTKAELHRLVDELPDDVVARLENGSSVTFALVDDGGRLCLREIDPEQAWFWTSAWQRGEQEADADLAAERSERFDDSEAFLAALAADLKPLGYR